jgi:hypothetical protein
MRDSRTSRLFFVLCALAVGSSTGCSSSPKPAATPLTDLQNPRLNDSVRIAAVKPAFETAVTGDQKRAMRQSFESLAWSPNASPQLRLAILEQMLADPDPAAQQQTRDMLRLMLPKERSRTIVALVAKTSSERGWTEFVPALVRSYAQPAPVPDAERAERLAIQKLVGDRTTEEAIFDVFLNPPDQEPIYGFRFDEETRADAWDLLSRLDPTGATRDRLIAAASSTLGGIETSDEETDSTSKSRAVLRELEACKRDLKVWPATGPELKWLRRLRDPAQRASTEWWGQATKAVATLDTSRLKGFALRHVEPIRYASLHKPELLAADRESLLAQLESRIAQRRINRRDPEVRASGPRWSTSETLSVAAERLSFGDAVALVILDDAIRSADVTASIFRYVVLDREDRTTEYGGIIESRGESFIATLYPPRPQQRTGDATFIASSDMINASDRALAHFHYHAAELRNAKYAGPSAEDLEYAERQGRSCVVFTSLSESAVGVDAFLPGGVVIDMGELGAPAAAK